MQETVMRGERRGVAEWRGDEAARGGAQGRLGLQELGRGAATDRRRRWGSSTGWSSTRETGRSWWRDTKGGEEMVGRGGLRVEEAKGSGVGEMGIEERERGSSVAALEGGRGRDGDRWE